jgi:isoleucyl-tRNA synthetase
VLDQLFRATVLWLAPMLPFTAEEAWLARYPSEDGSVHLEQFPELPASWRDDALAEKWRKVRNVRRVVTGAIEIERAQKRIGSSLEAAPVVYVSDPDLFATLADIDLARSRSPRTRPWCKAMVRRPRSASMMSRRSRSRCGWRKARNAPAPGRSCRASAPILPIPDVTRATPRRCGSGTRCARRRSDRW